ncbi:nucleoside hydrolase [Devosia sp. LjRoot3]|uniref:nucleoside hydrolase n=1 Tax=Devosia sp. LjRoot3 TaxID=3342319 RepID=UPI003ED0EE8B
MKKRVIIDTDPGLDDAIAILFALGSGHFDVLGLTTIAGNIGLDRTTDNAGGLLAVMGRGDIPVIRGTDIPLTRELQDLVAIVHGTDGLKGVTLPAPLAPALDDAPGWIARVLAESEPGSVDILALGPLTNVAHVLTEHPEVVDRIGEIIVMGGTINEPGNSGPNSEFNFASDPEAASVVIGSSAKVTIIPLDVTRKVRAQTDYVEALPDTPHGRLARELLTAYLQDGRLSRPLHDPCVMLVALDPSIFKIENMKLDIDLGDDPDAGRLLVDRRGKPVDVALGVDTERALALLRTGFV